MLRLAAIPFYLLASFGCARAALCAGFYRGPRSHRLLWWGLALFFVLMTVSRIVDFEERWHAEVRRLMDAGLLTDIRQFWQPLAAVVIVAAGSLGVVLAIRQSAPAMPAGARRGLRLAQAAGAALVLLVVLRLISLHALDALIFGGPHINRVLDPGLTFLVAAGSWIFVRGVERR